MIEMISTDVHEYRQRQLKVGDPFMCDEEHVDLLTKLGRAKVKDDAPSHGSEPPVQEIKPRSGKNSRKRY